MKKFLSKIFIFLGMGVFGYITMSYTVNQTPKYSNDYMSAMEDKHHRVLEINSTNTPKIILAGGSNLAFGINSKKIQDKFSVPIVNLGLHAGLGLDFIIYELKELVKEGDVVFLSIEYFLSRDGNYELKKNTSNLYPKASDFYTRSIMKDVYSNIGITRKNLKKLRGSNNASSVYSRKGFNKYGDMIAHLDKAPPIDMKQYFADTEVFIYEYWEGIAILNDFKQYAKSKDIDVFFLFPNYPKSLYKKNQIVISKLQKDISNNLLIEIISTPQDFCFDDSLFYDTEYHLNKKGRELRTEKLIEVIKNSKNAQRCVASVSVHVQN